jgi:hypothetical protein
MNGIEHATTGVVIAMILLLSPVIYYIAKARKDSTLYVRKIPGVAAIDEATGRAAELGRPVSFTTGLTGLGPVLYACLGVLYYVAKKAAMFQSRLISPQSGSDVMAVSEDVIREAYRAEGQLTSFDPKTVQFLTDAQFAFAAGYMGLIQRENVGSAFLFGDFAAESLILAEAGQQIGAMQVAATVSPEQAAFFICSCDYTLIGEELFAASAYLTREPVQLGSLYGQDRSKLLLFIFLVCGVVIATFNALFPHWKIPNVDALIRWSLW